MRDKKFVKEELKQVKKQKKDIDTKVNQADGIFYDRTGQIMCCVPFMKCTRVGHPLPETMADGIKMCCTNSDCSYAKHLVHIECFRSLEQNLMTLITSKGYDKSLSEKLRISRERLWQKKGLALVQKNLKCVCGKGQMTRDNDAWEERDKKFGPPVEEKEKKQKTKTAPLPTITTTVKNRAPPPHDAKKLRELDHHFLSSRSPPREEAFLADKYGPSPAKTKNTVGTVSFASFGTAKPTIVNKQPVQKPSEKKYPIGFAPIEPKPRQLEEVKDQQPKTIEKEIEKENDQWEKEKNSEWIEPPAIPLPYSSPKADETLFPHYHYSYNPNPNLKNALVQTDETNFPAALIKEPWLRMYSSKDSYDSGLGSVHSQNRKDSSDTQTLKRESLNSGRSSVVFPPPAFSATTDSDNISSAATTEQYEEFTEVSFVFLDDGRFGIEVNRNGRKELLKNIFDNDWTPLYLSMADNTIEFGEVAQYQYEDYPYHVAYDILKIIGKPLNEVYFEPEWGFELYDNNGTICFEIETSNGRRRIPEETLLAAFFKVMKARAETCLNDDLKDICLSTNFELTESQKKVFKKAASKVHLEIERFDPSY